jgi:hypothetical protein
MEDSILKNAISTVQTTKKEKAVTAPNQDRVRDHLNRILITPTLKHLVIHHKNHPAPQPQSNNKELKQSKLHQWFST